MATSILAAIPKTVTNQQLQQNVSKFSAASGSLQTAVSSFDGSSNDVFNKLSKSSVADSTKAIASVVSSVSKLADSYNNFSSTVSNLGSSKGQTAVTATNNTMFSSTDQAKKLASIGITQNSDGTMAVDEKTLTTALQNDPDQVKSLIEGSSGIATTIGRTANSITPNTTASYMQQNNVANTNMSYTSFATGVANISYQGSIINALM